MLCAYEKPMKLAVEMVDSPRHKQQKKRIAEKVEKLSVKALNPPSRRSKINDTHAKKRKIMARDLSRFAALRGAIEMRLDEAT